jgi:hypothetical protein
MHKENIGSSFDEWLHEEGLYEEVTSVAVKRVLARQISQQMTDQQLSKSEPHLIVSSIPKMTRLLCIPYSKQRQPSVAISI